MGLRASDTGMTAAAMRQPSVPPALSRFTIVTLCYIGLEAPISRWVNIDVGLSLALILAAVLAGRGWRRSQGSAAFRSYGVWSIVLAYWVMVAAVAAWSGYTVFEAAKFAVWIGFIIPGLGVVLSQERARSVLLLGWAAGVGMYVFVAAFRFASGGEILDSATRPQLMGINRNGVNMFVLYLIPFLLAGVGPRLLRAARWPLLACSVLWIVYSGGRTALAGLLLVGLVYVIAQPGIVARLRMVLVAALVLVVGFSVIDASGGQAQESANRLTRLISGERDDSDEARVLVMRKGWNLALDSPAFGVGYGNFAATDHPVTDEAKSKRVAQLVEKIDEHNTFIQVMSETGFPGVALFIVVLALLGVAVWRGPRTREARAALAGYAGVMLSITFHTALGTALFIPMALMVGITLDGSLASRERLAPRA